MDNMRRRNEKYVIAITVYKTSGTKD